MSGSNWPERVAAVKHDRACAALNALWGDSGQFALCDCDRDARIGRGIEAALRAHTSAFVGSLVVQVHPSTEAAAARAFEEAV